MPDQIIPALQVTGHPDALLKVSAWAPRVTSTDQISSLFQPSRFTLVLLIPVVCAPVSLSLPLPTKFSTEIHQKNFGWGKFHMFIALSDKNEARQDPRHHIANQKRLTSCAHSCCTWVPETGTRGWTVLWTRVGLVSFLLTVFLSDFQFYSLGPSGRGSATVLNTHMHTNIPRQAPILVFLT